jgi:hypothetical protein
VRQDYELVREAVRSVLPHGKFFSSSVGSLTLSLSLPLPTKKSLLTRCGVLRALDATAALWEQAWPSSRASRCSSRRPSRTT